MKYVCLLMSLVGFVLCAEETVKENVKLDYLRVEPKSILLDHQEDFQSIIAQAFYEDEKTKDILSEIEVEITDPSICVFKEGVFFSHKNGKTSAIIRFQGKETQLEIECKDTEKKEELSFSLHVMPVFTKAGCNTGGCHGASRGQDKFNFLYLALIPKEIALDF